LIIYDEKYWKSIVNFDGLIQNNVISPEDMKYFTFCSSVTDAFDTITKHFEKHYLTTKEKKREEPTVELR